MRIINFRKNDDADQVLKTDLLCDLNIQTMEITESNIYENFPQKRVLLIVHGYNNDDFKAKMAYRMINQNMRMYMKHSTDYEMVGVMWPGGDTAIDYLRAHSHAKHLAKRMCFHLQEMYMASGNMKIDIMCHSMGCFLVMEALKTINKNIVGNVFLLAAAIDHTSIQKGEEYYDCVEKTEKTFVLFSPNDDVLKIWYTIPELDKALGVHGVENKTLVNKNKVCLVDSTSVVKNHSDYKEELKTYRLIDSFYDYATKAVIKVKLEDY